MKKLIIYAFLIIASTTYTKSLNGYIHSNKHWKEHHKHYHHRDWDDDWDDDDLERWIRFRRSLSPSERRALWDFHKKLFKYKYELYKDYRYKKYNDPTRAFIRDYLRNPYRYEHYNEFSQDLRDFLRDNRSDLRRLIDLLD